MKVICTTLLLVFLFSCKPTNKLTNKNQYDGSISNQDLTKIMDTLASDYMEGRAFGSPGIEKAAIYIENFFKENDVKPYFNQYRDSFLVGARIGYNVIGIIEGEDPILKNEFIILSAHYDHIGKSSNAKDSVYNGANDNASGVSAVLNIAKSLKYYKSNKRSIVVALFTGEEIGLRGSEHFADKVAKKTGDFYCAVNIDMIGSVLTDKPGKVYLSGFERSNMGAIFNKYIGADTIANIDQSLIYDVFELSDNYPLYEKLKIPAHTFCTFDFNNYKHYHRLCDEMKNVDIENTGIIVRNIALGFTKIAASDVKEIVLPKD